MSHIRRQIRDAIITVLQANVPSVGMRVYPTRTYPVDANAMPALCVYTLSEESAVDSLGPSRGLTRVLDVVIEAVTKVNSTLDDALDQICQEVESAIGLDTKFDGLVHDCLLTATRIAITGKGETETGSAAMTFRLQYRTRAADPSVNAI